MRGRKTAASLNRQLLNGVNAGRRAPRGAERPVCACGSDTDVSKNGALHPSPPHRPQRTSPRSVNAHAACRRRQARGPRRAVRSVRAR
eukprot:6570090-Prymnesium_polylepis.1